MSEAPEKVPAEQVVAVVEPSPYTEEQAAASLQRATRLAVAGTIVGAVVAWVVAGRQSAALLAVGGGIAATGLLEWRRLMAALLHRMTVADAVQSGIPQEDRKAPSIAFAVAGFVVRLAVVVVVLYVSLEYLHGSVLALAAGLAMGVVSLLIEGLRALRSGII